MVTSDRLILVQSGSPLENFIFVQDVDLKKSKVDSVYESTSCMKAFFVFLLHLEFFSTSHFDAEGNFVVLLLLEISDCFSLIVTEKLYGEIH